MVASSSSAMGVRIHPGDTRFTRTAGASSTARLMASDWMAPFVAA